MKRFCLERKEKRENYWSWESWAKFTDACGTFGMFPHAKAMIILTCVHMLCKLKSWPTFSFCPGGKKVTLLQSLVNQFQFNACHSMNRYLWYLNSPPSQALHKSKFCSHFEKLSISVHAAQNNNRKTLSYKPISTIQTLV